jgi:hypothetical protein
MHYCKVERTGTKKFTSNIKDVPFNESTARFRLAKRGFDSVLISELDWDLDNVVFDEVVTFHVHLGSTNWAIDAQFLIMEYILAHAFSVDSVSAASRYPHISTICSHTI